MLFDRRDGGLSHGRGLVQRGGGVWLWGDVRGQSGRSAGPDGPDVTGAGGAEALVSANRKVWPGWRRVARHPLLIDCLQTRKLL
eukprot:175197-Pleurochrysis_carterae.AAC.1